MYPFKFQIKHCTYKSKNEYIIRNRYKTILHILSQPTQWSQIF